MGDDADNIPGAPGIGEKTAAELIDDFGSLDKLLERVKEIKQEKLKKIITDNIDKINLSRELAVLDRDVDIDFDLDKLKIGKPDFKELFRLFKYLEFKRFLKGLPQEEDKTEQIKPLKIEDKELKGMIKPQDELALSGESPDNLVFHIKDQFFQSGGAGNNLKDILKDPR